MSFLGRFILALLSILTIGHASAQYAGVYSVGGADADWSDPNQAIQSIKLSGTSAEVWLMVAPGEYEIDYWSHVQPEHRVHVVGTSGNAEDVHFVPTGIQMNIQSSRRLSFKHIFFDAEDMVTCLGFSQSRYIHIDSCQFRAGPQLNSRAVSFFGGITGTQHFRGNVVLRGNVRFPTGADGSLKDNVIAGSLRLESSCWDISNNHIEGNLNIRSNSRVFDNYIGGGAYGSHSSNIEFYRNHVEMTVSWGFVQDLLFHSNTCMGVFNKGSGPNVRIINNHFHGTVSINLSEATNSLYFLHNNIAPGNWFRTNYADVAAIKNNNFGGPMYWLQNVYPPENTTLVASNNFYPSTSSFGADPYHIDPMYLSEDSLVPTNPLLAGKGAALNVWPEFAGVDINGQPRYINGTIGANEFCVSPDTVILPCGESVSTAVCGLPPGSVVHVSPDQNVRNPEWDYPLLEPEVSTTYTLTDTVTGLFTELHVEVISPAYPQLDTLDIFCGFPAILLELPLGPHDLTVNWSPEEQVLPSLQTTWFAFPEDTTSYFLHVEHPHCEDLFDTVLVRVNPLPRALPGNQYVVDWGHPELQFSHNSYCTDSVVWHFGDGHMSNADEPMHIYDSGGFFQWTFIASNELGADTVSGTIFVMSTVGVENEANGSELLVYPNPHSGAFHLKWPSRGALVRVEVYDLQGRRVWDKSYANPGLPAHLSVNLPGMPAGMYVLRASDGLSTASAKMGVVNASGNL